MVLICLPLMGGPHPEWSILAGDPGGSRVLFGAGVLCFKSGLYTRAHPGCIWVLLCERNGLARTANGKRPTRAVFWELVPPVPNSLKRTHFL